MPVELTQVWPNWGDTGSRPADGENYQAGENLTEAEMDYLWYQINELAGTVETTLNANESSIEGNATDIAANATAIGNNATAISSNDTDITNLENDLDGYKIRKNGTDGTNVINFKT